MALNVRHFQQRQHLPITGKLDARTAAAVKKVRAARAAGKVDLFLRAAKPVAHAEFVPKERTTRSLISASGQRTADVGGWFDQYRQALSDAQTRSSAAYADATNRLQGEGTAAQQADNARTSQLTGTMAIDAAA